MPPSIPDLPEEEPPLWADDMPARPPAVGPAVPGAPVFAPVVSVTAPAAVREFMERTGMDLPKLALIAGAALLGAKALKLI